MEMLYTFPQRISSRASGELELDWGGGDPFRGSADIAVNDATAFPQTIPGAFSADECAAIVQLGAARIRQPAAVDDRSDLASRDFRLSDIAWIEPAADAHWLYHRLGVLFGRANAAYGFDIRGFVEPLQFTCYGARQYFGWHVDIGAGQTSARKLSLTIQLAEENDYEGGDLRFHGAPSVPEARAQGAATFFPAFLAHEVTPVTRGLRRSLVAWAYGPAFR